MDKGAYNSFTITNTIGQALITEQINSAQTTVNVKTLPGGMYYITFRGDNGTKAEKFVKM